jgi:predicted AAA+ superfamily ATPase
MELYFDRDMKDDRPNSSGGNILITGMKGVGKTTLMKGLFAIIKIHGVHAQPT